MRILATLLLICPAVCVRAQSNDSTVPAAATGAADPAADRSNVSRPDSEPVAAPASPPSLAGQQPKRILGVMPNYRAVSAGAIPPPPTPRQAFGMATSNSFDYSAFAFVGVTSLLAWGTDAHPQLRSGIAGLGRYYWRGFLDKTDGNYLVLFAFPSVFHQDTRYYTMGHGRFWKRMAYSASRTVITPDYHGHASFNASEVVGRGLAQVISISYYPSGSRTPEDLAIKFGYAVLRDTATNMFREFWPDIAIHVLRRHP